MPIVNRTTEDMLGEQNSRGIELVHVNHRQFYFTKTAARTLDVKEGSFMHFDNDGKSWGFFINDDPGGFPLVFDKSKAKYGGFIVNSRGLCRLFLKSTGKPTNSRFHIVKTNAELNGCAFYEIVTEKTADEILKIRSDRKKVIDHVLTIKPYGPKVKKLKTA